MPAVLEAFHSSDVLHAQRLDLRQVLLLSVGIITRRKGSTNFSSVSLIPDDENICGRSELSRVALRDSIRWAECGRDWLKRRSAIIFPWNVLYITLPAVDQIDLSLVPTPHNKNCEPDISSPE